MNNFNLIEYLSNNPLLKEDKKIFYVYKVTNNASESENFGRHYVGALNYRFDTPEKIIKFLRSKVNDTTTGGGAKALSMDLAKFGLEDFDIKIIGNAVSKEEGEKIKANVIADLSSKEYYNQTALANIGGIDTTVKDLSGKYQIRQLTPNKSYVLVNDIWYDTPKVFDPKVGDNFKDGKITQVLSYNEFTTQHPKAKEKGF